MSTEDVVPADDAEKQVAFARQKEVVSGGRRRVEVLPETPKHEPRYLGTVRVHDFHP